MSGGREGGEAAGGAEAVGGAEAAEGAEAAGDSARIFSGVPIPVEPARIEKELMRLWKPAEERADGEPSVTRACLSNVIVHAPSRSALEGARPVLEGVMRRHPSRMILIADGPRRDGEPGAAPAAARARAAITAVCHVPRPGAAPTCCEQIILEGDGVAPAAYGSIVTSLLVSDIPTVLVPLGGAGEGLERVLEGVLDLAIFDSRALPLASLRSPLETFRRGKVPAVDDLAWKEILGWRRLVADVFDDPPAAEVLRSAARIEIRHAPGSPSRPALLAGWLSSRLGSSPRIALEEESAPGLVPGEPSLLRIESSSDAFLQLRRLEDRCGVLLEYRTSRQCGLPRHLALPATREEDLLGLVLEQPAAQRIFRGALEVASGAGAER